MVVQRLMASRIPAKPGVARRTSRKIASSHNQKIGGQGREAVAQVVRAEGYDPGHQGRALVAGILLHRARADGQLRVLARARGGWQRLTPRVTQQRGVWRHGQCEDYRE